MMLLLMYILKFSESGSKKFAGPPKFGRNPIGGSTVTPLRYQRKIFEPGKDPKK